MTIKHLFFILLLCANTSFSQNNDCTYTIPFYESFENNSTSADCWSIIDLDPAGTVSNLTWNTESTWPAIAGGYSAKLQSYWNTESSDDWLISPTIELNGNQRLRFKYQRGGSYYSAHFRILLSTTGNNPEDFTEIIMPDQAMNATSPEEIIINLNEYSGNVNIAFHVPDNDDLTPEGFGWDINIDEIYIEDIPTCPNPGGLTVNEITSTSALLSWIPGYEESQWQIAIIPANQDDINEDDIILVDETTYLAEELTPSTEYKFFVRAYCEEDDQSEWIEYESFFTDGCDEEDKCVYKVIFHANSSGGGYGSTLNVIQSDVIIHDLMPNTWTNTFEIALCEGLSTSFEWNNEYWTSYFTDIYIFDPYQEIIFEYHQGDEISIPFFSVDTLNCSTDITCFIPQNFEVGEISSTSVELSWDEMGTATTWEIVILPQGEAIPDEPTNIITTTENPVVIENLNPGTAYSFYVRAICGENDISNWSFEVQAHTLITNDGCENAYILPVSEEAYCTSPYRATLTTATPSEEPSNNCGNGIPNDDVWFQFTATSDKHILYINNVKGVSTNIFTNDYSLNKILYSGNCNSLTEINCFEGSTWPLNTQQNVNQANIDNDILLENLTVGETYTLRIYSNFQTQNNISFDICIATPEKPIFIDSESYSVEELISDVLMDSNCGQVSNIQYSTGTTFGAPHNGIGYFEKGDSAFPFENGIILSTGNAADASGHKLTIQSKNFAQQDGAELWEGDDDLLEYVQSLNIDESLQSYYNATVIEFDFVSNNEFMSFDFIFASEDYGRFQCQWADAFAFFLTDSQGNTTNLALVPDTETPISVTTIRNSDYNYIGSTCSSENASYFGNLTDGYKGISRYASNNNFYGNTVPLTAYSDIIPGEQYHIKLVIADRNDGNYDSAVFLKGGSFAFNTEIDLGEDLLVENNEALCPGENITLSSPLVDEGYTYNWYKDGVLLDENSSSLTVTETGNYSLTITFPNSSCEANGEVRIEFYEDFAPLLNEPQSYFFCFDEDLIINLEEQEDYISPNSPVDLTFSYHHSFIDAENGINQIENTTNYSFDSSHTLFVRIESVYGCYTILQFDIHVGEPIIVTHFEDVSTCSTYTLPPLSEDEFYYTQSGGEGDQLQPGDKITEGDYIIYVFKEIEDCYAESSFNIKVKNCYIPKGISPNGDGLNDYLDLSEFVMVSLKIVNRYGTEVFTAGSNYSTQWQGQDKNNNPLPSGTYFYEIITIDDVYTGWIQIMREIK